MNKKKRQPPKKQSRKYENDPSSITALVKEKSSNEEKNEIQNRFDNFLNYTTKWIPIACGIAIVIFTAKIMCDSEKSMKIANRAYITISVPQEIEILSNLEIKISVINTGKTPAYNVGHITNFGVQRIISDTLKVVKEKFLRSTAILGKDARSFIHFKKTFSDIQITEILNKTIYLTIIGTIKYLDIFKREQFLEFNLFYDVDRKAFVYREKHNNAS